MSRDYVHYNQRKPSKDVRQSKKRKKTKKKVRRFPWTAILLLFIVLALFISVIVFVKGRDISFRFHPKAKVSSMIVKQATPINLEPVKRKPQKIKFDFYSILPKPSINAPVEESIATPIKTRYIVHIVSLRDIIDAVAYKDKVHSMGFNVKVVTIQRGGAKWYRLQIGPFPNKQKAEKIRDSLLKQHIESVLVNI